MYRGVLCERVQLRYAFIQEHQNEHSNFLMCRVLEVAKSGYYKWVDQPKSNRQIENEELLEMNKFFFDESFETYGSPRITVDLNEAGYSVSENRVARIMREAGIAPIRKYSKH